MLKKGKLFYPSKEFKKEAWVKSKSIYGKANKNPLKFWGNLAKEIYWMKNEGISHY